MDGKQGHGRETPKARTGMMPDPGPKALGRGDSASWASSVSLAERGGCPGGEQPGVR